MRIFSMDTEMKSYFNKMNVNVEMKNFEIYD